MERTRRLTAATLQVHPFNEESATFMDFADNSTPCHVPTTANHRHCVGLTSRKLAPHHKTVTWVDTSQNMVDRYNLSAYNQSTPPDVIRVVCVSGITYCS
ncbi:hypothetical protein ID866_5569 [Astraeus odoratus]|nr:hypothetical protein ID866_5569 [Astraeus odoratus]